MSELETVPADARKEPKVIKRYTNRKLYDTEESRYVTLDEISEMIRAGTEVQVLDNRSKEDLTSVTLAQIIFEEEKKRSKMPLTMLRDIIRHSGESLSGFLSLQTAKLSSIKEEAERLLRREEAKNAPPPAPVEASKERTTIDQAKEFMAQSQRALDDWQKRVDERVRQTVENVSTLPALAKDLSTLEKKIAELERRLDEAEKK